MKIRGDIEVTPRFNNGNGGITIERQCVEYEDEDAITVGMGLLSLEEALQLAIEILNQRATITGKPLEDVFAWLGNSPHAFRALEAGDVVAAFHRAEDATPRKTT